MTYQDIYTKFMIEYDKANVTSSYPMLTEYEVATILDRAYLALIWQKVSGNNTRRVPFEYDLKAIADIQPLIRTVEKNLTVPDKRIASNIVATSLPTDCLSFVDLVLKQNKSDYPLDEIHERNVPTTLIPHSHIENFLVTPYNMPWIKKPVCFLENNNVNIAYDTISLGTLGSNDKALITYIKQPISFVKSLVNYVPTDEDYQNLLTLEDAYELFVRKWQDVYTGDGPSEVAPPNQNDNQGGQTEPTNPENPGGNDEPDNPGQGGDSPSNPNTPTLKSPATWGVLQWDVKIQSENGTFQIQTVNNDNIHLNYSIGNNNIATVSDTGLITAISNGITLITVYSNETDNFYYKQDYINLEVDILPTQDTPYTYTITITSLGPGTTKYNGNNINSASSRFTVDEGSSITVSTSPNSECRVKTLTVNGVNATGNNVTIENVDLDIIIVVTYEHIPRYTFTITSNGNGNVHYDARLIRNSTLSFSRLEGSNEIIQIDPDDNYQIKSVTINGIDATNNVLLGSLYKEITANINCDTTVVVEFEQSGYVDTQTYTLTIQSLDHGRTWYNDTLIESSTKEFVVNKNSSASIILLPNNNCRIRTLTENGINKTATASSSGVYTYNITDINQDINISVEYEMIPQYLLKITTTGDGLATFGNATIRNLTESFYVNEWDSVNIYIKPDNGKRTGILNVTNNGTGVNSSILFDENTSIGTYTILHMDRAAVIEILFKLTSSQLTDPEVEEPLELWSVDSEENINITKNDQIKFLSINNPAQTQLRAWTNDKTIAKVDDIDIGYVAIVPVGNGSTLLHVSSTSPAKEESYLINVSGY